MSAGQLIALLATMTGLVAGVGAHAGETLPMRNLSKGGFSGITELQQVVIKEEKAWQEFWTKHSVDAKSAKKIPKVNFDKEMVVAVALGQQRTGGYLVEILRIEKEADKLKITIKRRAPPPDGILLQTVTSPFHCVAVAKCDLKPQFVEDKPPERK